MPLVPCATCGCHHLSEAQTCPHCGALARRVPRSAAGVALSLAFLAGCVGGGSDKDSGTSDDGTTLDDMWYTDTDYADADADTDLDTDVDTDADTDGTGGSGITTIEPLYGVITTGGTGGTTGGSGDSGGSGLVKIDTGTVEPLYGVTTTATK